MKQRVSEIIDNRLAAEDAGSTLEQVVRSEDGCRAWRDYHLIGDVIRGESLSGRCLMSRIGAELENEPTVLAPQDFAGSNQGASQGVATRGGEAIRSAGLFAIAASLALVAVVTLSPQSSEDTRGGPQLAASDQSGQPAVTAAADDEMATFESEFGQMLVEHGEFTATSGLNGLLAYAKLVSNASLDR